MKLKLRRRIIFTGKTKRTRRLVQVTLVSLIALSRTAKAQQVIGSPSAVSVMPPALAQNNNEMQVFNPAADFLSALEAINLYQWGPVSFRPSINYGYSYGTGIQSAPGQPQSSVIQTISPNLIFILGTHWTLDYTPTWTFYSSKQLQDTVSHSLNLNWGTDYDYWVLGASQGYSRIDAPLVETGAQTEQESYSTAITAGYQLNSKVSLNFAVNQNLNFNSSSSTNSGGDLDNSREWSATGGFAYHFWSRFDLGANVTLGYDDVDTGPDTVNEQFQGQLGWRATDKTSFQITGGLEDEQFLSGGADDLITPVFGASIQYQPFDQTQISLSANRTVTPSDFQDAVTENTDTTISMSQRLLGKLNLTLGAAYNSVKYITSTTGSSSRTDDFYSLNAGLNYTFKKRLTTSLSYQYSDNSSSITGFSYSSTQIGFQAGFQF